MVKGILLRLLVSSLVQASYHEHWGVSRLAGAQYYGALVQNDGSYGSAELKLALFDDLSFKTSIRHIEVGRIVDFESADATTANVSVRIKAGAMTLLLPGRIEVLSTLKNGTATRFRLACSWCPFQLTINDFKISLENLL